MAGPQPLRIHGTTCCDGSASQGSVFKLTASNGVGQRPIFMTSTAAMDVTPAAAWCSMPTKISTPPLNSAGWAMGALSSRLRRD
jgi:hypothetical protein